METKFDELFKSNLMFEEQRNGDVEISDCDFVFCTVEDCLAQDDGKALDRAKYIVKAANLHHEMYETLESIFSIEHERGGSLGPDGSFYYKVSEDVFKSIGKMLAKARGEHE